MVPRPGPGGNLSSAVRVNLPPGLFSVVANLSPSAVTGPIHPAIDLNQNVWLKIEDKDVLNTFYKELESNYLGGVSFNTSSSSFDVNTQMKKFGVGASPDKPVVLKHMKPGSYTVNPVIHVSLFVSIITDTLLDYDVISR